MTLRRKAFLIIGTILTVTAVLSCLVIWRYLTNGYVSAENDDVIDKVNLAGQALIETINNLSIVTSDWAHLDETYHFINNPDKEYIDSNFNPATIKALRVDLIIFRDRNNRIVHSYIDGKYKNLSNDISGFLNSIPEFKFPLNGDECEGILIYNKVPFLISAQSVTTTDFSRSNRGTLIIGRLLGVNEFARISRITRLPVSLSLDKNFNLPDQIWIPYDSIINFGASVKPVDSRIAEGYGIFKIGGSDIINLFEVSVPRIIYNQGLANTRYLITSVGIVELLFSLLIIWLLEYTVLARLSIVTAGVKDIGKTGDTSIRLKIKGNDELCDLANAINGSLDALDKAHSDLRNAYDELELKVQERTADLARTNNCLRESEQRMRTLIDNLPFSFWATDADGKYTMQNMVAVENFGYTLDMYAKDAPLDSDIVNKWHNINTRVLSGEVVHGEMQYDIDGKIYDHEYIVAPVKDGEQIIGTVGISIDVSEKLQAVDRCIRSEATTQALLAGIPDLVLRLDKHGYFVGVQDFPERYLYLSPDRFIDKHVKDVLPPHVADHLLLTIDKALDTREMQTISYNVPIENGYLNYEVRMVPNGENEVVIIARDFTEQVKAEKALLESHRMLEALMECIPDGIAIALGPDVHVRWVSRYACEFQGSTREIAQSEKLCDRPDGHNVYQKDGVTLASFMELPIVRSIKLGETVIDEEWIIRSADGEPVPILVNSAPIKDENGEITGGVLAWRDVSVLKQANKALEDAFHREHHIADVLQRALIPNVELKVRDYSFTARYESAFKEAEVGGDFYDIFKLSDGRIALLMGDVSGKGLPAAVYTAMAKYMLRAYVHEDPSPSFVMTQLNESMCDYTPEDIFATVFYGILDPMKRTFIYTNAGHDKPVIYNRKSGETSLLESTGRAVGVFKGCSYEEGSIRMTPGDVLVLYTDGVTDARNNGKFFGVEGISDVLIEYGKLSGDHIADAIISAAITAGNGPLRDDAAVLIVDSEPVKSDM